MVDLRRRSIDVILHNQAPGGAYVACPNMADYAYCWFRDGAFIAYAMDVVGRHASARSFYQWGADVINGRAGVVGRALQKVQQGRALGEGDYLHTRYTLDGAEGNDEEWPNFQLDGIGTWLWGMQEHLATSNLELPADWARAARLAARYLSGLWPLPNYDLWEEFGDHVHPYTLSAIYAGLRAYAALSSKGAFLQTAGEVRATVLQEAVVDGHFVKYLGSDAVDASLLGLAVPYGLVSPGDERMKATVACIEARLRPAEGGVHRYAGDTYYGGGPWVLLAAWLGWYYALRGDRSAARAQLQWIESQGDVEGNLPEQVAEPLLAPKYYEEWVDRRGPVGQDGQGRSPPAVREEAVSLVGGQLGCSRLLARR
jgi:GH15 family glucan-1,4-alpha-glucosidase